MTRPAIVSVDDPALPYSQQPAPYQILAGDCLETLKTLADGCVQMVCTSPPYYSLRDYQTASWEGGDPDCQHSTGNQVNMTKDAGTNRDGVYSSGVRPGSDNTKCRKCGALRIDNQIGLESSPEAYVAKLVEVFREVRRALRDDGTLWLNLGDSYNGSGGAGGDYGAGGLKEGQPKYPGRRVDGLKPKDLIGIPWMTAFALRADGWYLRSAVTWCKANPMPESVLDRPTSATEQVFLFAKRSSYYYNADAIRESYNESSLGRYKYQFGNGSAAAVAKSPAVGNGNGHHADPNPAGRNRRNWWVINSEPYREAHFATMPTKLVEPCILAGSRPGDTVLDPFSGASTTGLVALKHGRKYVGCELNEDYITLSHKRLLGVASQQRLFEVTT